MALVNRSFSLDITPGAIPQVVNVSEYDENREYTVKLIDEGGEYAIPSGTTATVDGTIGGNGFSEPATISGNSITFTLTESMTASKGDVWAKIKLVKDSKPIQTCAFILRVDKAGLEAGTVTEANGFDTLVKNAVRDVVPEVIEDYIPETVVRDATEQWLDAHPEATTTVQDNSLTYEKFADGVLAFVSPEMFGAKGDGETDDTEAVAACFAEGSPVLLRGEYLISSQITTSVPLVLGAGGKLVFAGSYAKSVLEIAPDAPVLVEGLEIDCGGKASYGLSINSGSANSPNSHPITVRNVEVKDTDNATAASASSCIGIWARSFGGGSIHIEGCYVHGITRTLLPEQDGVHSSCGISAISDGLIRIVGNKVDGVSCANEDTTRKMLDSDGIHAYWLTSGASNRAEIHSNEIMNCTTRAIKLQCADNSVVGNQIVMNDPIYSESALIDIQYGGGVVDSNRITVSVSGGDSIIKTNRPLEYSGNFAIQNNVVVCVSFKRLLAVNGAQFDAKITVRNNDFSCLNYWGACVYNYSDDIETFLEFEISGNHFHHLTYIFANRNTADLTEKLGVRIFGNYGDNGSHKAVDAIASATPINFSSVYLSDNAGFNDDIPMSAANQAYVSFTKAKYFSGVIIGSVLPSDLPSDFPYASTTKGVFIRQMSDGHRSSNYRMYLIGEINTSTSASSTGVVFIPAYTQRGDSA